MNELRVVKPRQARSRATMERILTALEELLTEKPFDQITIAEISARSASAPTAIYARFSDKTAMLLAVHERFKERTLDKIIDAIDGVELPPKEFLAYVVGELVTVYRDNHRLLRSVLLSDNSVMYGRAAEIWRALSAAIAGRLAAHIPADRMAQAERDLDFAVRTLLGLAQQELLFGTQSPARFDYPDTEFRARLTRILVDTCAPYLNP
ncbi:TetR/AcrR family transcriptional regulator [Nonomuraea sp. NPDC026600]|uniref:TetR/AcrR family transcriptional regulator n=1 Tax=Nonomuraea sp. NPDC026600 TaxID=3155363 RepID=UPI0033D76F46